MRKSIFLLLVGLLFGCFAAKANTEPKFQIFQFSDNSVITKMSDNGKWAVAKGSNEANPIYSLGARLINVETGNVLELAEGYDSADMVSVSANDVTDDGKLVVGEFNNVPAVWNADDDLFTTLPMLSGCDMGYVSAVTPDGRYAVGVLSYSENIYAEVPVMWDLTLGSTISLSGLPTKDMSHQNQSQNRFTAISPDGNYIVGCMSFSYLPTDFSAGGICQYVYNRKTSTYKMIGFTEHATEPWTPDVAGMTFVSSAQMSNDGAWVTGEAYVVKEIAGSDFPEETLTPYIYNVATQEFQLYSGTEDSGIGAWVVDNDGTIFGATPYSNPYREWSVRSGKYWFGFAQILKQKYGIDFTARTGIENTGTPISVSNDGKTMAVLIDPYSSYVVSLPETFSASCEDIDLLGAYTVSPAEGTSLSKLQIIDVTFDRKVEVLGGTTAVEIRDEAGNKIYNSVSFKTDNTAKTVNIRFRSGALDGGKKYTLHIPEGSLCVSGDASRTNKAIDVVYNGRAAVPVKLVSAFPEAGSTFARLDASSNPVILTFDAEVAVAETATPKLYREGETQPFCTLAMVASGKQAVVYPTSAQYLYKGTTYKLIIPAGSVTDLTGSNGNEEITLTYNGNYEREISYDDKHLYKEDFGNGLSNMLLFDGDKRTPSAEMKEMGFADAQNYPWWLVRETSTSTDWVAASHSLYASAGQSQDWMVVPQLYIPDGECVLNFLSQSYRKAAADRLKVIVWQSDEMLNALNADVAGKILAEGTVVYDKLQLPGVSEDNISGEWMENTVSLAAYSGKNIYIAFLNDNTNQSLVMVDNIEVVHNVPFLVTIDSEPTVVDKESIQIKGRVTADDALRTFSNLSLELKDSKGKVVDVLSASGLALKKGDSHAFAFAKPLPLTVGVENAYTITVRLDDAENTVSATVKNLAFSPVKRVVLEEYTGMSCQNCPLGILAIEKIKSLYGKAFIPLGIHTYPGDQLGTGLEGYSSALGFMAAPSGMINRSGVISSPMISANQDYMFTAPEGQAKLWLDLVQEELEKPAEAEVAASVAVDEATGKLDVFARVRYALNAKDKNLNLLLVLIEDNVLGYQSNNLSGLTDPDLGEWKNGGKYGQNTVYPYYHNHVVRALIGRSENGTGGYLPSTLAAGEAYNVVLATDVPESVSDVNNLHAVVMLLDGDTGAYINAVEVGVGEETGIAAAPSAASDVEVSATNGMLLVSTPSAATVYAYTADGRLLGEASGSGTLRISTAGYRGMVVVKAIGAGVQHISKHFVRASR